MASLAGPCARRATTPRALAFDYRPKFIRGLQVILAMLLEPRNAGVADAGEERLRAPRMASAGVQFVSATAIVLAAAALIAGRKMTLNGVKPAQITLGGEVVDQMVLDMIRSRFPAARLIHIFATTELGTVLFRNRWPPDFPRHSWNVRRLIGVELRIEDDEFS